jgi:hypothetical protein
MIVAGMATMPDRLPYLEEVVETIRPQVDALRVYLNNFEEIPGFCVQKKPCSRVWMRGKVKQLSVYMAQHFFSR